MGTSVATARYPFLVPGLVRIYRSPVAQTFATTVAIIVLGLISGIQIARALGPNGRGEVAAALLWPGLLVYIASIGLAQAVVVFAARASNEKDVSTVFSTASCMGLVLSSIGALLGGFFVPFVLHSQSAEVVRASRVFLLSIPSGALSGFAVATLQGRCSFLKLNFVRLIVPVGYVMGLAAFVFANSLTVMSVAVLQLVLSYAAWLAGWFILAHERIFFSTRNFRMDVARQLLSFGGKAYAGTLSGTLNQRLDQALLAAWFPAAQLGLYSVATSTAGATDTISFAFRTVVSGRIAQKSSLVEKQIELRQTLARFLPILVTSAGGLALLLPIMVPLFYGSAFRAAILPAEVLLIAQVFYATKNLLTSAAEAFGDSWLGSKAELIGIGPNLLLLVVLLPRLGILGAAVAAVFAYLIEVGVMLRGFARKAGTRG